MNENILLAQGILEEINLRMAGGLNQAEALAEILAEAEEPGSPAPAVAEFPASPDIERVLGRLDTLDPTDQVSLTQFHLQSARNQADHYLAEAERLRRERQQMEAQHQQRIAQQQAQQQARMEGNGDQGIATWDTKSLRHLDPASLDGNVSVGDLERLTDDQWVALASGEHGRSRLAQITGVISQAQAAERASQLDANAPDPRITARLEQMSPDELYRAMSSGYQNESMILGTLSDLANSSTPAAPRSGLNMRDGSRAA